MTPDHAHIAQLALEQYGLGDAHYTLSQVHFNTTYCVTAADGRKFNLRLCGAYLQNEEIVHDELTFIDFVAQRGDVRVPKPVLNLDHKFVTQVEVEHASDRSRRLCCLFEWIEGDVVRDHLTDSVLHKMGRASALLHQATKEFRFPTPDDPFRHGYYYDEKVIIQHRDWIAERQAEISPERTNLLHRTIDHLLEKFDQLPKTRATYGFIHADLNPNNFIVTNAGRANEEVSVIDFEQLGRGHFCVDLATTMVDLDERKIDFEQRWSNFKQGYQTVTNLPFEDECELDPFVMAIHLNFLDWIYNTPTPQVRAQYEARFQEVHDLIRDGLSKVA